MCSYVYRIQSTPDGLELTIEQFRPRILVVALVCALSGIIIPAVLIQKSGITSAMWGITPFALLLLLISLRAAIYSRLRRSLVLGPSDLVLRSSFFGLSHVRVFQRQEVRMGFRNYSHSPSGGLQLLYGRRRIELTRYSGTDEVKEMLADVRRQGFILPD